MPVLVKYYELMNRSYLQKGTSRIHMNLLYLPTSIIQLILIIIIKYSELNSENNII